MAFVYILRCADGSYYVGSTRNLERRLWEHNHSDGLGAQYTRRRRPVELAWSARCDHIGEAFTLEMQIQGWSRSKRQALVDGRFTVLPDLARGHHGRRDGRSGLDHR